MLSDKAKTFQLRIGDLEYRGSLFGQGERHILYFHGFAQDSTFVERILTDEVKRSFTIISMGLFFHESEFPRSRLRKKPLTRREIIEMYLKLKSEFTINELILGGYSLGARMTYELLDLEETRGIFLLAPDGLARNTWYYLFTHSHLLSNLAISLSNSTLINGILKFSLKKFLGYNDYEMKLISSNLEPGRLRRVFDTWNCYKAINRNYTESFQVIKKKELPHFFIFSSKDQMIGKAPIKRAMNHEMQIKVVEDGHDLIKEKNADEIEKFLLGGNGSSA